MADLDLDAIEVHHEDCYMRSMRHMFKEPECNCAIAEARRLRAERDELLDLAEKQNTLNESLHDYNMGLRAERDRLRAFVQTIVDASDFDFTDWTLYEWVVEKYDEAVSLLDDNEGVRRG